MGRLEKGGLQDSLGLAASALALSSWQFSSGSRLAHCLAEAKSSRWDFLFLEGTLVLIPPVPYPLSLSTLSSPPLLFPSLARSTLGSVVFSSLPLCQYLSGFLLVGHPLDLISVPKSLHPSHSTLRAHISVDTRILGMRKEKFNLRKPRWLPCSGSHFDKKQMQKQS